MLLHLPHATPDPARRRLLRNAALLALAGSASPARALPALLALPRRVRLALHDAGIDPGHCSFVVRDLELGTPLVDWLPRSPRSPASVLKLVTLYVALHMLGPDFRWSTPVYALGPLRDGVLSGDLAFVGSGDPHLVADDLMHIALRLRGLGLRRLAGNVLVDRSAFDLPPHDPAAFDGHALAPYNAGADAFLVSFGVEQLHLQPLDDRVAVWGDPPLRGFAPQAPRLDAAGAECGDWRTRLQADFSEPLAPRMRGSFAATCGERTWNVALPMSADAFVQAVLGDVLQRAGIEWSGQVVAGRLPASARLLTRWDSQPLAVLMRDIAKFSNNVMTEQVFLTLALQAGQAPADFQRAAAVARQWLDAHGLSMPDLELDNGCGLSRSAQVSARDLERLLRAAWRSPLMPEFLSALPLAGEDGTLREHLDVPALRGRVHAKTGTLDGVRALAGYLQRADERRLSFVALIDDPRAQQAWPVLQALLEHAAAAPRA